MAAPTEVIFDLVQADEIPNAIAIELQGFPPGEAADIEKFRYRQEQAPDLFLGAFSPRIDGKRRMIGYICSTLSPSEKLTHESMSVHVPSSTAVCIHSICIEKQSQRKGIATRLLKEYISRLRRSAESGSVPYQRIMLISHENLVPFYENAGFTNLGRSEVVHGPFPWYELRVELKEKPSPATGSASGISINDAIPEVSTADSSTQRFDDKMPPGLWEALLQSSSGSSKPSGKRFSSFENPMASLTAVAAEGTLMNKSDLLCPRPGCGSVVIKEGVGRWTERASEQLQPSDTALHPVLPPLPPPGDTTLWWLVTPSPMAFENIGFSKPVGTPGSKKKLLICGECDLGPLGWSEEGGTEFWLACSRVAYRT